MAEKNRQIAEAVVKAVGGTANITSVAHCMTRLRFVLKDKSIPNKKEVEKIPGVMGVNIAGGQYQVIIGNSVGNVYKEVVAAIGISDTAVGGGAAEHTEKVNPIIPAMLSTLLLKYVEKLVDRITPEWSKSFLKPLLIVMIVTPITLCAIAPLGLIIGNGLQFVINGIYGFAPWLAMMLFAGFMPFIVMTGMHWAFVPASMLGISGVGYDLM